MTALSRSLTQDECCALAFYRNALSSKEPCILLNHDQWTHEQFIAFRNQHYSYIPSSDRSKLSKLVYSLWEKSHLVLCPKSFTV